MGFGVSRPMPDEVICGDRMAVRDIDGHRQILLSDGAGHGALAAVTADAAVRAFGEVPEVAPDRVVAALHDRLLASVGAAVAVADFSPDLSEVRYAAVGDVEACLSHPDGSRQILTPQRGIVGRAGNPIRQRTYPLAPGAVMVVHSDGVSSRRWQAHEYPDLLHRSPQVIAAALLRDAGTRRDDASVLVVKVPLAHAPGSSRTTPA